MGGLNELAEAARSLEGRPYPQYRRLQGDWQSHAFTLRLDRVQGDPFAPPSALRAEIPERVHRIPWKLRDTFIRRTALADFLLAILDEQFCERAGDFRASGGSGRLEVDAGGAAVLPRSAAHFDEDGTLEVRFSLGLPARGRRILGRLAAELLTESIPRSLRALELEALDLDEVTGHVDLVDDHRYLQSRLRDEGLIAFVRDGSVLPRASGVSEEPLAGARPFRSPAGLRVTLPTQHHGPVTGMGLAEGVTLLVGGGFHGKSTLLNALAHGIYPHCPTDGRHWVVTREDALKVRSEDGRPVCGVDIRPFITSLPGGRSTAQFTTASASGSTSLAASLVEGMAAGSGLFLLDEDTCANNLLVRDDRMRALIRSEPIVPLLDRLPALRSAGVSLVLALGGSGPYLDVADRVVRLEEYAATDCTEEAREVSAQLPRGGADVLPLPDRAERRLRVPQMESKGPSPRVRARGTRELTVGEQVLDLHGVEQLIDESQLRSIGVLLRELGGRAGLSMNAWRRELNSRLGHPEMIGSSGRLAGVRWLELAAALNRLRSLEDSA